MKRFLLWIISVALGVALLLAAVMGVSYAFTTQGGCPDAAAQFGGQELETNGFCWQVPLLGGRLDKVFASPATLTVQKLGTLYTAHPDITLPDWASYTTLTIQTAVGSVVFAGSVSEYQSFLFPANGEYKAEMTLWRVPKGGMATQFEGGSTGALRKNLGLERPAKPTGWYRYSFRFTLQASADIAFSAERVEQGGIVGVRISGMTGDAAPTVETDLGGSAIAEQTTATAPKPGDNVITTIDLDLQEVAEKSLESNLSAYGKGGAAVALDPNTGEVLAMASYPTYDLANYNKNYASIQADSRHPEVNRATSGVYPPGSTFKMVTAIAGLEEGIISGDTYVTCAGTYEYGGQTFRCNNHDTPMTLNVTDALKYSCNTFFYTVGQKLTGEHLEQWTKKFGLGTATGIEVGEATGQAAGPTYREQQRKADPAIREWQGGDDLNAAIGQSDNGFTPLQLANYVSAIVNGGTLYKPTLVKSIKSYDYSSFMKTDESEVRGKIDISDATRELVMQGMSEVTDEGGTAGSVFADYPIKVGGKTGTAEMFENGESFDNGLFIAFAPFDNPQIVICVVGEGAGHGAYVAPIVRDMLDEYFSIGKSDSAASRQAENTLIR